MDRPAPPTGHPTGELTVLQLLSGGHRLRYVRLLAEGAHGRPTTLVTTTEARDGGDFEQHLAALERSGRLHIRTVGSATDAVDDLLRGALDPVTAAGTVVVPDADRLLVALCRYGLRRRRLGRPLPGLRFLLMRTPEAAVSRGRDRRTAVGKVLLLRALAVCWPGSRAFFLTDAWGVVTRRRGYGLARAVRDPSPGLPDVARAAARAELGLDAGQFVLGLLGAVSARKRPDLTVTALRQLPGDVVLLVAGQLAPATREWLAARGRSDGRSGPGRLVIRDGYLSDAQLAACVHACDALVLTYDVDAPSGLLLAADEAGVPVVAAGSPWLCRVVSTRDLGVVEELSVAGVVRGVTALRAAGPERSPRRGTATGASGAFAAALTGD